MVLNGFNFVKALKAIAVGNYSRRRNPKWFFKFFVFLFLFSRRSSLFSLADSVIHHFFRRLLVVLNSHIFVFVIFHAILFVVYSLSRLTDNKSGSNQTDSGSGLDGRHSHVIGRESSGSLVAPSDDSVAELLVVDEKNTETARLNGDSIAATPKAKTTTEPVIAETPVTKTTAAASPARHLNAVTKTAEIIPRTKRCRRMESERFEENRERSKFQRSKTEISGRDSRGEPARFLNSVDEMDIDDFNRAVESFITEQKMRSCGWVPG